MAAILSLNNKLGILRMNTLTSKPKRHWWQMLILGLEAYLMLVSFVLLGWHFESIKPDPAVGCMLWSCVLSLLGLFVASFILNFKRQPKWGWTTLIFVGLWLAYFSFLVWPVVVRASGY
jgi:hypothetical protein